MEETLTDCLVRVREDLSQLKKVRAYLDTNAETEERCSVTWRTIEAFNSILSVCSSQSNSPETNALDTLLDSFNYLARNNSDDTVWDDFGFELGIICVKVLSAIERSDAFEILFCKLLSVISIICEHNSNVWKATARQILNVLINKKFSLSYLEAIVKLYVCLLKNIESSALQEFSSQNLHLLRTLSLLVQKVGDFEIQSSIIELVFLHLSKETKLMSDFFSTTERKLLTSLQFTDFEHDCRLYLNEVNKSRRGSERKVYSICCHVLYLGGCFVEPPLGRNSVWVDANKDSQRVSIKCGDEEGDRIIHVQFSEIVNVELENDKTEGNRCLTIQTKNLMDLYKDAGNDDICLVADNTEEVFEFVRFLETTIVERKRKKKLGERGSKTTDCLVIDRNSQGLKVQDNAITSSERPGIDHILPDVLSLFAKANRKAKTPPRSEPQVRLSPKSFADSLNKHIGLGSPELRQTYEDSVETIEFLQKSTPASHKLFRSPEKIFEITEKQEPNFNFDCDENKEPGIAFKPTGVKTYSRRSRKPRVLKNMTNIEMKMSNSQSQDYFRKDSNVLQKKPCLPRLKRSAKLTKKSNALSVADNDKTPPQKQGSEQPKSKQTETKSTKAQQVIPERRKVTSKPQNEVKEKVQPKPPNRKLHRQNSENPKMESTNRAEAQTNVQPSLLDPNGYAYQRWCKPTTSERSNFWLKKLDTMKNQSKVESESVFDFSEDSEPILDKKTRKKRVSGSKAKCKTRQTSLRQVKEILKKSPPKGKPKASPRAASALPPRTTAVTLRPRTAAVVSALPTRTTAVAVAPPPRTAVAVAPPPRTAVAVSPPRTAVPALLPRTAEMEFDAGLSDRMSRNSSPERLSEQPVDTECESVSEEEDAPAGAQKRDRSDEDSSSKVRVKKKAKTAIPKNVLSALRRRLQKTEQKDRQQTEEIIQTISRATNHLFNHIQRKDGERVVSYLKAAETSSTEFDSQIDELHLRLQRIRRAVLYYKAGCSVADFCESLHDQFSRVREALKGFREKTNTSKTIERVNARLSSLIKSGIEKTIGDEWTLKRNRLMRCATILGVDFRERN